MRYLPLSGADRQEMLNTIGVSSIDALFEDVPSDALNAAFDLSDHMGELEVERALGAMRIECVTIALAQHTDVLFVELADLGIEASCHQIMPAAAGCMPVRSSRKTRE